MRTRISALPVLSAAAAVAWLIAQAGGFPWLAAFVTVFVLFGSGLVARARRRRSPRRHLALGLTAGGGICGAVLAYLLVTDGGGTNGLLIMLALAVLLMLPVPLLYAFTFPLDRGDAS